MRRSREKLFYLLLSSMLLWLAAGPLLAAPPPRKWAVVVGVNEYHKESVTDLKYAVDDAKLFAQALTESAGFSPDNVFLFTSDASETEGRPRLTNLIYRLESLKDEVGEDDTVFFYFAGHGVEMEGETFLLTENADNRSRATLTLSALPAKLLMQLLEDCNAKDTLVVLDACRNNPMAGRGTGDNRLSDAMSRGLVFESKATARRPERSLATLLACGVDQRSYEWPAKQHGFFTYNLVEGMRSGAADNSGKVSLAGLSRYVRDQVSREAQQEGHEQQPTLKYEGPGPESWIIARTDAAPMGREVTEAPTLRQLEEENARLKAENAALKAEIEKLKSR